MVCREAEKVTRYWGCGIEFTDDPCPEGGEYNEDAEIPAIELPWLEDYKPNALSYPLGTLEAEVCYDKDAAVTGDRASKLTVVLRNPHPVEKNIEVCIDTSGKSSLTEKDITLFNKQYPKLKTGIYIPAY